MIFKAFKKDCNRKNMNENEKLNAHIIFLQFTYCHWEKVCY